MIQVQNLTKKYGTNTALNNISFTVKDGEILGFLGPNGAGKTTTMKILTGFTAPTAGEIKVDALDIAEDSLKIKQMIGYAPESVPLYSEMQVLEYLKFIAEIRNIPKNDRENRLKHIIKVCGLEPMLYKSIGDLSKGFKQRTLLAQALIHNPKILILDEPTSGLDPNQIAEIREVIRNIGKEKTVILSTHILPEVQAICSRVIIINEGKIVAEGTTEELERQVQGKQAVYVKMKGLKEKIHNLLLDLPIAVDEVKHKDTEGEQAYGFEVTISGDQDAREIIFQKAVLAACPILEMRLERVSLEDVFRKLTMEQIKN